MNTKDGKVMDNEFEKIYEWTNEKIIFERRRLKEYKSEIRQSEGLIAGIIILCLIIAFFAPTVLAKYIFITVAILMLTFCTFYTFKNERKIISKQNQYSEFALSELAIHIKDGFTYDKDEEISASCYKKSGFNRIYKELISQGVISGIKNNHKILLSNIIVKSEDSELFRGIFAYSSINKNVDEIDVMRVDSKNNKKEKYQIPNEEMYIYAEDIEKAREVMTDDVVRFIEQFTKETSCKLELMLNKDMIFFRFYDKDILTKPISNDKETKEFLYKYYRIIKFVSDFVNTIDK